MLPQGSGMGCPRIIYLICGLVAVLAVNGAGLRVCRGTPFHISHEGTPGASITRYNRLRTTYENCTFVDGNLEVVFLDEQDDYDLSFLSSIQEVTGYVLILAVYSDYVPLTNLRIIRGDTLYEYHGKHFALYIALNFKPGSRTVGLKELRFKSLHEIMDGDVGIHNNPQLCHHSDINWSDILMGEGAEFHMTSDSMEHHRKCGKCHPKCAVNADTYEEHKGTRHCWGEGPEMCQNLTREICSKQCEGRCYGEAPNQCCHPQCAAGCTGPTKLDCWACANFYDNGSCVPYCPKPIIYDEKEYKNVPNPDVRYAYGTLCVPECPKYLIQEDASCVKECGFNKRNKNGVCELCDGPCLKSCDGVDYEDFIHSNNSDNFTGCTQVKGDIAIASASFQGDIHRNIPPMHPSQLSVLKDIQEITGYLKIQGQHKDFRNLKFLSKLRVINGRNLDEYGAALHVYETSLTSLELRSLKKVQNGMLLVAKNSEMCYVKSIDWATISDHLGQRLNIQQNRPEEECIQDNFICHKDCSDEGCWGPGPDSCVSCRHFKLNQTCLASCDRDLNMYQSGPAECQYCDAECKDTCNGPGPGNCTACKHVTDGPYCKPECPELKYPDSSQECQLCHPNCVGGCTGPNNTIGPGACNYCALAEMAPDEANVTRCLPPDSLCSDGYFLGRVPTTSISPMAGKSVCRLCHQFCETCTGPGAHYCKTCRFYSWEGNCVGDCNVIQNLFRNELDRTCDPCHRDCMGCTGPSSLECEQCMLYKVYLESNGEEEPGQRKAFNCTSECPKHLNRPVEVTVNNTMERVCQADPKHGASGWQPDGLHTIAGLVSGICLVIAFVLIVVVVCWRQRARARENALKLTARMSGLEESEPLTPTDARPDMSMLRLIKESELRKGNIIGSGAFGTVYKGVWIPEGENVKIPVAIKVLQEGTSPSLNKELLEEARVMASVDHPCCVRILAVCMTAQMMLITQLMPLGCLLDYVRKHKVNIGSKALLNWCTQIAKGMAYLEEKGVVHRDLAARNVLVSRPTSRKGLKVQSPGQVKITDFGLAKLLDYNEEEYRSAGGKMPIKWLALECIQHRIFTHKSDVWSYGVTAWELFTYGQRPYENVRARDVPDLLEKGERLPQPSICTIDVYMIMIKCWMLDADSRPNFRELAEEFAKMARDPGRYLVIQGDKLLRLPSHTFDTKDLIRSMSVAADGPEEVMDAEDYLQPQTHLPDTEPTIPNGRLDKVDDHSYMRHERNYDDDRHSASRENSRDREHQRRDKKYSSLEAAAAKRKLQAPSRDSVSSRYSADPCKVPATGKEDAGEAPELPPPPPPPPSSSDAVPTGSDDPSSVPSSIKIDQLPIDEDDYLQPKSSNPAAYMDLIEGKDYLNPEEAENEEPDGIPQYLDIAPAPVSSAIDNPVYFDKLEPIPEVAVQDPLGVEDLKMDKENLRDRSLSTESSDPEYYNEYDKLNKDPKPVLFMNTRTESSV